MQTPDLTVINTHWLIVAHIVRTHDTYEQQAKKKTNTITVMITNYDQPQNSGGDIRCPAPHPLFFPFAHIRHTLTHTNSKCLFECETIYKTHDGIELQLQWWPKHGMSDETK